MFDPEQITFFAKTDARGQQVPFGIKANDRTKHVYVIGKTGMGKSTLLENMAVQDIKNGNGLAFIDPHGATAETILDYIPEERKKDVLYFAPFDTEHPISFNVMEDVGPDKRHLVVSGLMSVFKKIWVDAWSARMEYILSNTLLALLEYPDSTLLGVNRMLSDKHYRKSVIANISDPAVKSFWVDEFLNYNERYMQEAGDAIKNKIGQFTSNPLIRNIVGQPHSSFDIREIMDGRKILIANLSKGLVGESNANLLGSMLTTRIYLAAMSRADLSAQELKQMPNFYFYVDEFQSFANATFADILSEARKYKLNLTIAHQYIEQMEEEVRNAVFGNVGTIISFRVGPFDAEILETIFTPKFLAADIVNLGFAQIYLTLMIDGIGSQPFSATTLPPIEPPRVSCKDMVIATSRQAYAAERPGVEEKINEWHHQSYDEKKLEYEARKKAMAENGESPARSSQGNGQSPRRDHGGQQGNNHNKSNGRPNDRNGKSNHQDSRPPRNDRNGKPGVSNQRREYTTNHNDRQGQNDRNNGGGQSEPKEKNNEKNVEELRSILKNLAASTKGKGDKDAKDAPSGKRESTPAKKDELQAALKEVGHQPPTAPPAEKTTTNESSQPNTAAANQKTPKPKQANHSRQQDNRSPHRNSQQKSTDKRNNSSKPDQSAREASAPEATVPSKSVTSKTHQPAPNPDRDQSATTNKVNDPLAPNTLQRMMRVTGSDKSPFK